MKKEIINITKYLPKVLFWLLPLIYTFLYGQYGYDFVDAGLIRAGAWRVYLGEIPYRDFFYGKPPISLYLHSLQLLVIPDQFQAITERFLTYVQVFAYSFMFSTIIKKYFPDEMKNSSAYLLGAVTFIYSVHNWAPFSWYTLDGIFFSVMSFYILLTFSGMWASIIAMIIAILAALTKQSFYPIPIILLLVTYLLHGWKPVVNQGVTLLITIISLVFMLWHINILDSALINMAGQASTKGLINTGFIIYLEQETMYIFLGIIVYLFCQLKFIKIKNSAVFIFLIILLAFSYYTVKNVYNFHFWNLFTIDGSFLNNLSLMINIEPDVYYKWIEDTRGFFWNCFSIALFYAIYKVLSNKSHKWIILIAMLLIAWSAGVSYGYPTPANFSGPLIFGSILAVISLPSNNGNNIPSSFRNVLVLFLFFGFSQFFVLQQISWKDSPKKFLTYDLGEASEKLHYIKSDKTGYDKIVELYQLREKHGNNYTVLPFFPSAHYLTNTLNPLPVDTGLNSEYQYQDHELFNIIIDKNINVFVEKDEKGGWEAGPNGFYGSKILFLVEEKMKIIDESNHFTVYNSLKNN